MPESDQSNNTITMARDELSVLTVQIKLPPRMANQRKQVLVLILYLAALICGVRGAFLLRGEDVLLREDARELVGVPFLCAAFVLWLVAELVDKWPALRNKWGTFDRLARARWLARAAPLALALAAAFSIVESMSAQPDVVLDLLRNALFWSALALIVWLLIEGANRYIRAQIDDLPRFAGWIDATAPNQPESAAGDAPLSRPSGPFSIARMLLTALAVFTSAVLWTNSSANLLPRPYIVLWLVSAFLWAMVFAPRKWNPLAWLYAKHRAAWRIPWREYWWAYLAFALIMAQGASLRLTDLDVIPPEILNDTYLNLVDAYDFAQGTETPVYFAYNNGREPLTIYSMALLASAPGFDFDFYTLKLHSAFSILFTLPVMYWLGVELVGRQRGKSAVVLGLLLAGFVSVSYWELAVSRGGDIPAWITPFAGLLGIFLARALRYNRRADFVFAGLVLGFSLYVYKTCLFFPIVVVAAVLIAAAVRPIAWRERLLYLGHLAVLAFVALMVFLPMMNYFLESPTAYLKRAEQLVFDPAEYDSDAEVQERLERNVAFFMSNIRKHLLMSIWRGEQDWTRGLPNAPNLDIFTSALFVLGLAAVATRLLHSRDPVLWALPAFVLLFQLPAISVVNPDSTTGVPSITRAIGALPYIYFFAAASLALIARQLLRAFPAPIALPLGLVLCVGVLLLSGRQNTSLYFEDYLNLLHSRTFPTSEGGRIIRGFVESGGAYGNSFIISGYDTGEPRFIAAEAGVLYYPNVILRWEHILSRVLEALNRVKYRLDPNVDILFLYSPQLHQAVEELQRLFPTGHSLIIPTNRTNHSYALFRVPALGAQALFDVIKREARG